MISKEEQELEFSKIGSNIFDFLKYVKIQEPGELALEYQIWDHLRDFFNALDFYKLIALIKPKQIGVSWALAVYALWKIYTKPAFNVLEISKGDTESRALLLKSKIVYDNLPKWMKRWTLDPNSGEKFGFKEMHSQITSFPSTETSGLGQTAGLVIHDESDFHEYFKINLGHTLATVADSPDRKLVAVSTVDESKSDSDFQLLYKAAEAKRNNFHPLFYPYDVRPDRNEAWLEARKKENEATPWVVGKNFPRTVEEALSPVATQSCIKKETLDRLWYNTIEEPETEQGFIYILYKKRVGTQYVGGVDVGEGVGLDYSSFTIVGKQGLQSEVAANIYTNTLGTAEFAFEVDRLGRKYDDALICLDNIGIGRAVADKLIELGYPNLYYGGAKNDKIGWSLTKPNKRELAVKLVEAIEDGSLITRFKPQVKELMEYQWVKNYPEPTGKTHGDTVISLMLANQMLQDVGPIQKPSMYVGGVKIF